MAETQVLQGRIAVSGGVVRTPSAGQVLEQRQPPVALSQSAARDPGCRAAVPVWELGVEVSEWHRQM